MHRILVIWCYTSQCKHIKIPGLGGNKMHKGHKKHIIIEGITDDGHPFRPSDWAERMCANLCTFNKRRMIYSPLLQPTVNGGHKCISIDPELEHHQPAIYKSIMEFAHSNHLRIFHE